MSHLLLWNIGIHAISLTKGKGDKERRKVCKGRICEPQPTLKLKLKLRLKLKLKPGWFRDEL